MAVARTHRGWKPLPQNLNEFVDKPPPQAARNASEQPLPKDQAMDTIDIMGVIIVLTALARLIFV